ncbi:hypothetical protein [Kineosporia babensis]|uniref:Uncharacterized protein n=1 Tax=Kineosporia babensis TaxID=499548 RepID=A0A9X1SYG4_9ACTN|nr:hypothetical protein [Kineosporia babensis]MCD5316884.1 hypothetical protein [Kineosporia babensis]
MNDQQPSSRATEAESQPAAGDDPVPWPQWRQRYVWTTDRSPTQAPHGVPVHRSFADLESAYDLFPPDGFRELEFCSNRYRRAWASSRERIILTYCESDLTYLQFDHDAAYRAEYARTVRFYLDQLQ